MADAVEFSKGITYQATVSFRWVDRGDIMPELQQAWQGSNGSIKWEAVPTITEEEE